MKLFLLLSYLVLNVYGDRVKRIVGGEKAAIPRPLALFSSGSKVDKSVVDGTLESTSKKTPVYSNPGKSKNSDVVVSIYEEERSSKVYGIKEKSGYYSFKGIQYGEPPIKRNRFQRPIRKYLNDEVQATTYGPPCVQPLPDKSRTTGDEDCLYLNVYTPNINSKNGSSLPVLFWIHGGGLTRGSGNQYGVSKLVKKRIVVVTINYRLGTLGFLGAHDQYMAGNAGLFDVYAAFAWTQTYISYFCGNPGEIFVAGQGNGASMATLLAQSTFTRSYIKGVFAMSGTGISSNAVDYMPSNTSFYISDSNGCLEENKLQKLRCLQKIDVDKLILTDNELQHERIGDGGFVNAVSRLLSAGPIVEGENDPRFLNYFLNNVPLDALKSRQYPKIPLLTGVTKEETGKSALGKFKEEILDKLEIPDFMTKMLPLSLIENNVGIFNEGKVKEIAQALFGDNKYLKFIMDSSSQGLSDFEKVIEITTDALFNLPAVTTSKLWGDTGGETYFYRFEHATNQKLPPSGHFLDGLSIFSSNVPPDPSITEKPFVSHGDDLLYLFDLQSLTGEPLPDYEFTDPRDIKVKEIFTNVVASFLQNRKPKLPEIKQEWPLFKDKNSYVVISEKPKIERQFRYCQLALWEGALEKLKDLSCNFPGILPTKPHLPPNSELPRLDTLKPNLNSNLPSSKKPNLAIPNKKLNPVENTPANNGSTRLLSHVRLRLNVANF